MAHGKFGQLYYAIPVYTVLHPDLHAYGPL